MTADDLVAALAQRHAKDVFVAECKMGESWGEGVRRLDAWAMTKSWSPWTTCGYEVKVSRSDFLSDRKWERYLPVCHEFSFMAPRGLIAPEELPPHVGLLWAVGDSGRLVTKRKAVRREPEPEALLRLMSYVLMSRTQIVANMWRAQEHADPAERWRELLTARDGDAMLGRLVGHRVRTALQDARNATRIATQGRDRLAGVRELLTSWGLDPETTSRHDLERRFAVPRHQAQHVERLATELTAVARAMREETA